MNEVNCILLLIKWFQANTNKQCNITLFCLWLYSSVQYICNVKSMVSCEASMIVNSPELRMIILIVEDT